MTLAEFLLARITEVESIARDATAGPWSVDNTTYAEVIYGDGDNTAVVAGGRWGDEASVFESTEDALHIARHDPAYVLAECEAKRRIVERYIKIQGRTQDGDLDERLTLGWVIDQLAAAYANHPEYDKAKNP